jgi:hypothetical protein
MLADAEGDFHLIWLEVKQGEIVFEGNVDRVGEEVIVDGLYNPFLAAEDVAMSGTIF